MTQEAVPTLEPPAADTAETVASVEQQTRETFLIADCGHTTTTVAFFDRVAGVYRLVAHAAAPTTIGPPHQDVTVGIRHAVEELQTVTGHQFLSNNGRLFTSRTASGAGVDHFACSFSAAPPLRVLTIGLMDSVTVDSAQRALGGIYHTEVEHFNLVDERPPEEQIEALVKSKPELIFVAGGTDGGARDRVLDLVKIVALGAGLLPGDQRPEVLYAGNEALREEITKLLAGTVKLHMARNVRPSLGTEDLGEAQQVLGELYAVLQVPHLPAAALVNEWTRGTISPTVQATAHMARYFSETTEGTVLLLDCGSDGFTVVAHTPTGSYRRVYPELGSGKPLGSLLQHMPLEAITAWLTDDIQAERIVEILERKRTFPQTIPDSYEEWEVMQAVGRALLAKVAQDPELPQAINLLLLRGGMFTQQVKPQHILSLVLDGLQPTGTFAVAVDQHGVLPALGLLAQKRPLAAVQALDEGALVDLGWTVALKGSGRNGQKALKVKLEADGHGPLELDVPFGTLEMLPLFADRTARLTLKPRRRFDIGFGRGRGKSVTVHGGALGIILDARGRPLKLPKKAAEVQEQLLDWRRSLGG